MITPLPGVTDLNQVQQLYRFWSNPALLDSNGDEITGCNWKSCNKGVLAQSDPDSFWRS